MLRPAHLEPGQRSRSFERTGHVATVPNICPYKGTLSRLTKHSAVSRQALEPALVGREGRGGSEAHHRGSRPTAPPIRGAMPPPSLKPPPHQPSQASTLRPCGGCMPSCPLSQSSRHHRIQVRSRGLRMAGAARIGVSLTQLMPLDMTGALSFSSRIRGTRPPRASLANEEWTPAGTTVRLMGTGATSSSSSSVPTSTQETH